MGDDDIDAKHSAISRSAKFCGIFPQLQAAISPSSSQVNKHKKPKKIILKNLHARALIRGSSFA
jgi:hypothetical protein